MKSEEGKIEDNSTHTKFPAGLFSRFVLIICCFGYRRLPVLRSFPIHFPVLSFEGLAERNRGKFIQ